MILSVLKQNKIFQKIIIGMVVTAMLAACTSSSIRDTYDLTIKNFNGQNAKRHKNIQLLIAKPEAVKILDGQDIVIRDNGAISYLKDAQWSDRLPNLVQARFVQAFENSGLFAGIGRPGEGLAVNYQILTDIRAFDVNIVNGEKNANMKKIATVEIGVKILNDQNGSIVATKVFQTQSMVDGNHNQYYTAALNIAFKLMTKDIVAWVASKL